VARNARLLTLAVSGLLAACFITASSGSAAPVANDQLLIEHWDGTAWTKQATPAGESLQGIAALSPTNVWAVGRTLGAGNGELAVHWDGSSWQRVSLPKPGGSDSFLWSVAGHAAGDVWAVGDWQKTAAGPERPLTEHWNGTRWRIVPSPHPRSSSRLLAVAVLSLRNAWAVGGSTGRGPSRALIEHWNGTRWRIVPSPLHPRHGPDELAGVAAVSPRSVWAVGERRQTHWPQPLVLHWNGNGWSRVRSPYPGVGAGLFGVAAAGPRDVWAVGEFQSGRPEQPLAEHWDGRSWRSVPVPAFDLNSRYQALAAVAAGSAGVAWAAGYVLEGPIGGPTTFEQPLLERWDGASWTPVTPSEPATRGDAFYGLAALSSGDAWAVGWTGGPTGRP
jgi:hypothetical protein